MSKDWTLAEAIVHVETATLPEFLKKPHCCVDAVKRLLDEAKKAQERQQNSAKDSSEEPKPEPQGGAS